MQAGGAHLCARTASPTAGPAGALEAVAVTQDVRFKGEGIRAHNEK